MEGPAGIEASSDVRSICHAAPEPALTLLYLGVLKWPIHAITTRKAQTSEVIEKPGYPAEG